MARGPEDEIADTSPAGVPARGESLVPTLPDDELWLQKLDQLSPVALYRCDRDGYCRYVNERWCELTGLSVEESLGMGWARIVHPDDVARVSEEAEEARRRKVPLRTEYRCRKANGQLMWVLVQAVEEHDDDGELIGYISSVSDVTELHEMREALERSHAELECRVQERTQECAHMAMIVDATANAVISSDLEGRIVSWNPGAERIFGYTAEEAIGQTTFLMAPADRLEEAMEIKKRVREGHRVDNLQTVRLAQSGELIEVELSVFPLRDPCGRIRGTSAIVRDIRQQKKAERRLRKLSGQLLRLQDEERRRLARDLHDSTAQTLAALSINLSVLNQESTQLDPEKRARLLADSLNLANGIGRDLRTHAYLLHPPLLDERGLSAALQWLAEGFTRRSGIQVKLDLPARLGRLPDAVELTIFRVVQESLSNIHRHAKSATATIRMKHSKSEVTVEVEDAGGGSPQLSEGRCGVGIAGMRERLAQVNGTLTVTFEKDGATVYARIPLV